MEHWGLKIPFKKSKKTIKALFCILRHGWRQLGMSGITKPVATDNRPTRPLRLEESIDVPPDGPAAIKVNVYEPLPPG